MAELKLIKMSEIQSEPVDWLWEPYIPRGAITRIQGDGGDGHVINLYMPMLKEIGRLTRNIAGNMNQVARRVNSGGEAYREDIKVSRML